MRAAQGGAAEGGAAEGGAAEEPTALLSMELSPAIAMFFKRHQVESNAGVVKILSDLGAKTVVDLTCDSRKECYTRARGQHERARLQEAYFGNR